MKEKAITVLVIALIVLAAVAGILLTPIAPVVAVVLGVAASFLLPNLVLDFACLYVNGELDIDRIASKAKRKRIKSLDLSKMEIMAPLKSHRLDYQNHNKNMKVFDFSSGNPSHNIYAMIIPDDKEVCKVLIEPDMELIKNIEKSCPRKVFTD